MSHRALQASNVLLVGGSGYLGRKFADALPGARIASSREGAAREHLDLLKPETWEGRSFAEGDVLILLAAESAPDACSRDPLRAEAINVAGTLGLITQATAAGARVIAFSSDVVLGESAQEADENSLLRPVGPYAEMKAKLERACRGNPLVRVARLSYVCGADDKFSHYLSACARAEREAEIFDPFVRSAVAAWDVVDGVLALAQRWDEFPDPVINFAGPVALGRAELAQAWAQGTGSALRIKRVDAPAGFFDSRPRVINMVSRRFSPLLAREPRPASQAFSGTKDLSWRPA